MSIMVFGLYFQVPMLLPCSSMGAQPSGFAMMVHGPHQECIEWLLLPLLHIGRASGFLFSCPPSHSINMAGHIVLGAQQSSDPSVFTTSWGGIFFSWFVPSSDIVDSKSVVGIKPGDSGVVIG